MHSRLLFLCTASFLLLCACQRTTLETQPETDPASAPSSHESTSSTASAVVYPSFPTQLSVAALGSIPLRGSGLVLEAVLAHDPAYTRYRISYDSNGLRISGILNVPVGEGPFPLVLLNHGYIDPAVYTNGRGLKREQAYLAQRGFAVLHSDYRGHAASDPDPDTREIYDAGLAYSMDVINAIEAVRSARIPGIDARHVGMLGHSMGGGITLNIATALPELVDAVVLYAPVHADAWENFVRWRRERPEGDRTLAALGTREENPAGWDALSSKSLLDRIRAPILLFHGDADRDVPKEWSDALAQEFHSLGKEIVYREYTREGHEFGPQWQDFMEKTAAFFARHLTTTSQASL